MAHNMLLRILPQTRRAMRRFSRRAAKKGRFFLKKAKRTMRNVAKKTDRKLSSAFH